MTSSDAPATQLVQGPVHSQRWGSVGFLLDDRSAVRECRRATRWLLQCWNLSDLEELVDDAQLIVSELVTNAQRHAGDAYHAGSFTVWFPGDRVVITVHDKGELPYLTNWWSDSTREGREEWHGWVNGMAALGGRGLALVRDVLAPYDGHMDVVSDQDPRNPGKVTRVVIPLPESHWRPAPAGPVRELAPA